MVSFRFCIAAEHQFATVGGGEVNIHHLHAGELFQRGSWRQARCQGAEFVAQGHMEAVAQKSHEDVGLDAVLLLVEQGPDLQVPFEIPEGRFGGWAMGQVNIARINPSLLLKYSVKAALDPFSCSGRASMALLDELIATASVVSRGA